MLCATPPRGGVVGSGSEAHMRHALSQYPPLAIILLSTHLKQLLPCQLINRWLCPGHVHGVRHLSAPVPSAATTHGGRNGIHLLTGRDRVVGWSGMSI